MIPSSAPETKPGRDRRLKKSDDVRRTQSPPICRLGRGLPPLNFSANIYLSFQLTALRPSRSKVSARGRAKLQRGQAPFPTCKFTNGSYDATPNPPHE